MRSSLFVPKQTGTERTYHYHEFTSYVEYDQKKMVDKLMVCVGWGFVRAFIYALAAGVVAMWKSRSDFQELWEGRETAFGFPGFP